ncbi:hypothetical protein F5Y11DRAFT_356297 [Daldinia sp. FL1419]|nr:hypothetical protein F5Y11DRAFT_356297 [Daldinia sp. FL1419]
MDWTAERFSTYQQYKKDTETIAGWLVLNSQACGYQVGGRNSNRNSNPTGNVATSNQANTSAGKRLKGKARKEARQESTKPSCGSTQPQCPITVAEFGRMAKAIADFKPKVNIPCALDNIFCRVIRSRERFTEWYQRSPLSDKAINQSHMHFTGILADTQRILRPLKQADASHKKKQSLDVPKPEPLAKLVNYFSGLEVQEPREEESDSSDDIPDLGESDYKLTDVANISLTKSEEDIEEDFFFAIFAFMQDLDSVRSWVRESWQAYSRGEVDLVVPSLLTNTAIQLVRKAENEMDFLIDRPKKYPSSQYPVSSFPDIFVHATHKDEILKYGQDLDEFIHPSEKIVIIQDNDGKLCLSEIFAALKFHLHNVCSFKNGKSTSYLKLANDPSIEVESLIMVFPALELVGRSNWNGFASDEIMNEISRMLNTGKIPITTAFSIRLFLDLHEEIQNVPEKPVEEVKRHVLDMKSSLESKDFTQEPFTMAEDGIEWLMRTMGDYEKVALYDSEQTTSKYSEMELVQNPRYYSLNEISKKFVQAWKPDYLLRAYPVRAGMIKYGIYMQGGISTMMHLYIAARSLYPEDPVWPDMEYFLQTQDLDRMFVGGLPTTMDEAFKKYMLASGMPVEVFARNRRQNSKGLKEKSTRWASNPCLLDGVLTKWMHGGKNATEDTIINLIRMISSTGALAVKAKRLGISQEVEAKYQQEWTNPDRKMTTILENMMFFIINERFDLYFDTLSFAKTCQRIWRQIEKDLGMGTKGNDAYVVITDILDEARFCQLKAKKKKVDLNSFTRENATYMKKSWNVIQSISRKGMKASFGKSRKEFAGVKAWVGDKELFNVLSKDFSDGTHPHVSPPVLETFYKNWSSDDKQKSAVARMNGANI